MCSSAFWNTVVDYSLYFCNTSLILYAHRSLLLLTIMCISYLLTYLTVASMEQMEQLLAPPGLPRTISANHANLIKFLEE